MRELKEQQELQDQ